MLALSMGASLLLSACVAGGSRQREALDDPTFAPTFAPTSSPSAPAPMQRDRTETEEDTTELPADELDACPVGSLREDDGCRAQEWTTQFGTVGNDATNSVSVDSSANVIGAGAVGGATYATAVVNLPGQSALGRQDAFVRKYDAAGSELWTRQFGSSTTDDATAVSVDGAGNVLVAGYTGGALPGQASGGSLDVFVRKYDRDGTELWTHQFGSAGDDEAAALGVDGDDNVIVAGYVSGLLPRQYRPAPGLEDAFVRKYDSGGDEIWTLQFGSAGLDGVMSLGVERSGDLVVAGYTSGALSGQNAAGSVDAMVRKYDAEGAELWTRQFGSPGIDWAASVAVDASSNVFVATVLDQGRDTLLRKYDASGTELWTRPLEAGSAYGAQSLGVDGRGNLLLAFIAGEYGTAEEPNPSSSFDALVVSKYDPRGEPLWERALGRASDNAIAASMDRSGSIIVGGQLSGALPEQTSAGRSDAFVRKLVE